MLFTQTKIQNCFLQFSNKHNLNYTQQNAKILIESVFSNHGASLKALIQIINHLHNNSVNVDSALSGTYGDWKPHDTALKEYHIDNLFLLLKLNRWTEGDIQSILHNENASLLPRAAAFFTECAKYQITPEGQQDKYLDSIIEFFKKEGSNYKQLLVQSINNSQNKLREAIKKLPENSLVGSTALNVLNNIPPNLNSNDFSINQLEKIFKVVTLTVDATNKLAQNQVLESDFLTHYQQSKQELDAARPGLLGICSAKFFGAVATFFGTIVKTALLISFCVITIPYLISVMGDEPDEPGDSSFPSPVFKTGLRLFNFGEKYHQKRNQMSNLSKNTDFFLQAAENQQRGQNDDKPPPSYEEIVKTQPPLNPSAPTLAACCT